MQYRYFVSYTGKRKDGSIDTGHTVISSTRLITEPEDIVNLSASLQEQGDYETPAIILSYQLMSKVADE